MTSDHNQHQKGNAFLGIILIFGLLLVGIWYFNSPLSIYKNGSSTAQASTPKTHIVDIYRDGFTPQRIFIVAGDTVTFVNRDSVPHGVRGENPMACPGFDSLRPLLANETFAGTFETVGTCAYADPLDDDLLGRIVVEQP